MELKTIVFEWDQWNAQKNEMKHGVSILEAESVFYDPAYTLFKDERHSTDSEKRLILYGKSLENRVLMIGFTLRYHKIRIITARMASIRERKTYESQKKIKHKEENHE